MLRFGPASALNQPEREPRHDAPCPAQVAVSLTGDSRPIAGCEAQIAVLGSWVGVGAELARDGGGQALDSSVDVSHTA